MRVAFRKCAIIAAIATAMMAAGCGGDHPNSRADGGAVAAADEAEVEAEAEVASPVPSPTATRSSIRPPATPAQPARTPTPTPMSMPMPEPEPEPASVPAPPSAEAPSARLATSIVLQESGPRITAVVYPRPDHEGDPWSQWGQGVVLPDGRVVSAMGDHLGRGGNSYVFVHDPATGTMTRISDIRTALDHPDESWGFGKIHGQMVLADDGDVYFATYWGSRRGLEFDGAYRGDVLFRLDTGTLELESLGVPVPMHGIPSLAGDGRFLFGEAVDPLSEPDSGGLFVYDTVDREVVAWLPDERHAQFRNVMLDTAGNAFVASADDGLLQYAPGATSLAESRFQLADRLRASTPPDSAGTVYAVTATEDHIVAISSDGDVRSLGNVVEYTTSIALLPDESGFLFVPGAHGNSPDWGTPVIAVDGATGSQTTIVQLDPLSRSGLGLVLGGSYNVTVDPTRGLAHIGFNAGPATDSPWGEVVLVTIQLEGFPPMDGGGELEPFTRERNLVEPLLGIRGHAVAVADVDGDGWDDLFVGTFADRPPETYAVRGATGPAPDRLLLGGPDGFRLDRSFPGRLSRSAGAVFADLDDDGDPDLIVSRNVRNGAAGTEILRNDGGRFTSVGVLDAERGGRAVGTLDYDRDGLLDVYLVEDRWTGGSSVLYRNEGGLRFSDATAEAGLPDDVFGLGLGIADLDGDGTADLVVGGSNRIFLGDGAGGFRESLGADLDWQVFGDEDDVAHVAIGDVNGDGRPDLVFGQHYNSTIDFDEQVPVRLYLNEGVDANGDLWLRDVTEAAGLVGLPTKAPKVLLVDLDDDGWLDLITTASADGGTAPAVFRHRGVVDGIPVFEAPTRVGDPQYWIDAALLDADGDGRQDVFLVEWEPALGSVLLRNLPG